MSQPTVSFIKMHGAGNDFVIIDSRVQNISPSTLDLTLMADRRHGIGFDQLITLESTPQADVRMRIFNADGSEVAACGNATRCVGWQIMESTKASECTVLTQAGLLHCSREKRGTVVTASLLPPLLEWQSIPMAREMDTLAIDFGLAELGLGCAVNVGNPHIVFFVPNVEAVDLARFGSQLEWNPLFPERVNVEIVQVVSPAHLKMRVWERGAGLTQACGTGACASLVAAARRGLSDRKATVSMPGGDLLIEWRREEQGGRVLKTGDVHVAYHGRFAKREFAL